MVHQEFMRVENACERQYSMSDQNSFPTVIPANAGIQGRHRMDSGSRCPQGDFLRGALGRNDGSGIDQQSDLN
jgi:hypothetical protein